MYFLKNRPLNEIDDSFFQVFKNQFQINLALHEIIKMKAAGYLNEDDIKICEFIYKFTFLTQNQIQELMNKEDMSKKLQSLVNLRVLNKFVLSDVENTYPRAKELDIPDIIAVQKERDILEDECLIFYSLDMGGKTLLEKFTNLDLENWLTSQVICRANTVYKKKILADFYINVQNNAESYKINNFRENRTYYIEKKIVTPDADFAMSLNIHNANFVMLILRTEDYEEFFKNSIDRFEKFLNTNSWRKYFEGEQPVILYVAENDEMAKRIGSFLTSSTEIKRFRLSTFERLKRKPGSVGAFLRYNEKTGEIDEIIANTFS